MTLDQSEPFCCIGPGQGARRIRLVYAGRHGGAQPRRQQQGPYGPHRPYMIPSRPSPASPEPNPSQPEGFPPRNRDHKPVLGQGARSPSPHASRPHPDRLRTCRVRRRARRDRPRLLVFGKDHRHERRRGRSGERLLHLSWTSGSGRRRLDAAPGRAGRRLSAKTDGGLRQRPAAGRRDEPRRQGARSRQPSRRRGLLRRLAVIDVNERISFLRYAAPGLAEGRCLSRRHGLLILSRPQWTGRG